MNIDVLENPDQSVIDFFDEKINEFNQQHWAGQIKTPLAVQVTSDDGEVLAGASARAFGDWLMLDSLWVSDELRGQSMGSKVLAAVEDAGKKHGCRYCLLDTLDFQAKPFYEKHGFTVEWVQEGYPKTGCKYFMVKTL